MAITRRRAPSYGSVPRAPVGPSARAVAGREQLGRLQPGPWGPAHLSLAGNGAGPAPRAALEDIGEAFRPEEVTEKWVGALGGPETTPRARRHCPGAQPRSLRGFRNPRAGGRLLRGAEASPCGPWLPAGPSPSVPCLGELPEGRRRGPTVSIAGLPGKRVWQRGLRAVGAGARVSLRSCWASPQEPGEPPAMLVWGTPWRQGSPGSVPVDSKQGQDHEPQGRKARASHNRVHNGEEWTPNDRTGDRGPPQAPFPWPHAGQGTNTATTLKSGRRSGDTGPWSRKTGWAHCARATGPERVTGTALEEPQADRRMSQAGPGRSRNGGSGGHGWRGSGPDTSQRKPSRLIWQKLICSKFEDLIDDRGGRGSYRGGAPGTQTRLSPGALRTGHPSWL